MTPAASVSELLEQLHEGAWNAGLQRFRSPFAFRGMPLTTRDLSTSLIRLAAGADVHTLELALLRNFRKYAHGVAPGVDSIWHWLALGQHHGLPTRLVDWTYSPLVALHFATESPVSYGEDGAVWCVNFVEANTLLPRQLRRLLTEEHSQTLTLDALARYPSLRAFDALARTPFVAFIEPPSIDTRILNQFALFSLMSSPLVQLGPWLEAHPRLARRVVVPAALKWELRDMLDQANISERTLFPGMEGLSRWLRRYYYPRQTETADPPTSAPRGSPARGRPRAASARSRRRATGR